MGVSYDAVILGSGPNGLAAAIRLAQQQLSVLVIEGAATVGGGLRSAEFTLPGFIHDVCSAIHPLAISSPFFRQLPLEKHGLHWAQPEFPLAHPLEGGRAAILEGSVQRTAARLGEDETAYEQLVGPVVEDWDRLAPELLRPMLRMPRAVPALTRFAWRGLRSASSLANARFRTEGARALFAGLAAHSVLPLAETPSAAFGLMLAVAGHRHAWPLARGGSRTIAEALERHLRFLGGEIVVNRPVSSVSEIPASKAVLLDVTPRQLLVLFGDRLPASYRSTLEKFKYGPGVFKLDYALAEPIPWKAPECRLAGTVHLGGSFEEIALSEQQVADGKTPERPFVLLTQPTLFDPSRAPEGQHTAWAYCHVPNGSDADMSERIEAQVERFAPGFRDCILARHSMNCADMERRNANLVGGDISGGANTLWQLVKRPVFSSTPYRLPVPGFYLCSASTPPGGGVHGMCGFHAAEAAIRDWFS